MGDLKVVIPYDMTVLLGSLTRIVAVVPTKPFATEPQGPNYRRVAAPLKLATH